MDSRPGRLTGGGIRTLPADRVAGMLRRIKVEGSGKNRKVRTVRYRITGLRDPGSGDWVSRNPRNGHYYRVINGRHQTRVRPTGAMVSQTDMIALEVEVDRGGPEPRIYYVSVPGL